MYLHTGRSLRASNRSQLLLALGYGVERRPWAEMEPGVLFCAAARRRGFDSIQIVDETCGNAQYRAQGGWAAGGARKHLRDEKRGLVHACYLEIVSCHAGCMALPTRKHYGACADVPLRTGWAASRPCGCNGSLSILNCLLSEPALPPVSDALMATAYLPPRGAPPPGAPGVTSHDWPAAAQPFRRAVQAGCKRGAWLAQERARAKRPWGGPGAK